MLAFVFHARAHRRGVGRLPGRRQRHAEARGVGGQFAGGARAVQPVDQAGHHQLLFLQQRAPHRLGRVRGEDRLHVDARQPAGQFLKGDALRLEAGQRVVQPIGLRPRAAGPLVIPPATDAMDAFGDVHHLEVGAEGADQRLRLRGRLPVQQAGQRLRRLARLAARDRGGAYPFDMGQELRRDLFGQHFPHQRPQAAHVLAQRDVGRSEFEAAGAVHAWRGVVLGQDWYCP